MSVRDSGFIGKTDQKLTAQSPTPIQKRMRLSDLHIISDLQPRAGRNSETVEEYAEHMKAGDQFPALVAFVIEDRKYPAPALVAGFTRRLAYCRAGIEFADVEIRTGTFEQAWLFAWTSNLTHGLRYSNADKRHAAEVACLMFQRESPAVIANRLQVSGEFVRKIRKELVTAGKLVQPEQVVGTDGVCQPARKQQSDGRANPVPTVGTIERKSTNSGESGCPSVGHARPVETVPTTEAPAATPDLAAGGLIAEAKSDAKDRVAEGRARLDAVIRLAKELDEALRTAHGSVAGPLLDRVTVSGNPLLVQRTVRERKGTGTVERQVTSFAVAPALAVAILRRIRPKSVCVACHGEGCIACRSLGFVPNDETLIQDDKQLCFDFGREVWEGGAA